MIHQEFGFKYCDTNFYGQYWRTESAKAVILLIHGMGEHSSRYTDHVIPFFLKNNFSVITYDQFGHGKTNGKRGSNPGYEHLLQCISIVLKKAHEEFSGAPIFLYGHSMGGNLVINYALKHKHAIKGVVATSPFLELAFQPPEWKLNLGKILQRISPTSTMKSGLEVEALSRDEKEVKKYIEDPLVHDRIDSNYALSVMQYGYWAIKNVHHLYDSILILHGTSDRLTSYKASERFAQGNNELISLKLFQGGYHELHNDHCKEQVLKIIVNWLGNQLNTNH